MAADPYMGNILIYIFFGMELHFPVRRIDLVRSQPLRSGKILTAGKLCCLQKSRSLKQLLCLPCHKDSAFMYNGKLPAEFIGLISAVCHKDHISRIVLEEILHLPLEHILQVTVQCGKRLIQKNSFRLSDHHSGQCHSLLLSAGKL